VKDGKCMHKSFPDREKSSAKALWYGQAWLIWVRSNNDHSSPMKRDMSILAQRRRELA
jgi:hypothetical protein